MTRKLKREYVDTGKVKCADCINCGGECIYGKGYEPYQPRYCDHYMFYD